MAVTQEDVENRNRRTVQAGFDNWRDGKASIYDLLAPDAKWTIVGHSAASRTYASRQDFLDNVIRPFNARLSSRLVPTVRAVYADGDWVIVLWDGTATARDGKPYENTYSWFLQMQEGQIVSAIAFYDSIAFNDFWTRVKPAEWYFRILFAKHPFRIRTAPFELRQKLVQGMIVGDVVVPEDHDLTKMKIQWRHNLALLRELFPFLPDPDGGGDAGPMTPDKFFQKQRGSQESGPPAGTLNGFLYGDHAGPFRHEIHTGELS